MPRNGLVQWGWNDIEELLQCPVCLDVPTIGVVEQCRHGHHICANCKTQVDSCPLCKCEFHGTRNFVVEELLRHFEILKNTMLLNNIESTESTDTPKKTKKPKTKLSANAPVFIPNNLPLRRQVNTPNATKGIYPCRVVNCDAKLPLGRLLNHVRTYHSDILTESVVDFTDSYNQTWEVPFRNKKPLNRSTYVVFVRGIGLIFLNIEILRSGYLVAFIQMALKFTHAQSFKACLEFSSQANTYSYTTRLISIKDNFQDMMIRKTCFTLNKTQLRNICVNRKFNCKMRVSKFGQLDENILTPPNVEQMDVIAGIRASLLLEERDKKLMQELSNGIRQNRNGASGSNNGINHTTNHTISTVNIAAIGNHTPSADATMIDTNTTRAGRRRNRGRRFRGTTISLSGIEVHVLNPGRR